MRFLTYINESAPNEKLTHLEHLEDSILNQGINGAHYTIEKLVDLYDLLKGSSTSSLKIQRKFDGAPSLVFGIDPTTKRFFVSTKAAFNKNPKINYSNADVDANHPGEGLAAKLKTALKYLPLLGIKGVVQGDMMYTKDDVMTTEINGVKCYTFKPNTITYAVTVDSETGAKIKASKMGIALHTHYEGHDLKTMVAKPGIPFELTQSTSVFVQINDMTDLSGTATLTMSESKQLHSFIQKLTTDLKKLNPNVLNAAKATGMFELMKMYNNIKVKAGEQIPNAREYFKGFVQYYTEKKNTELEKYKTAAKQEQIKDQINTVREFISRNISFLEAFIDFYNTTIAAKMVIVQKLSTLQHSMSTFIDSGRGLKATAPEGFVAIDTNGSMIKLVDRNEFSKNNFNIPKSWTK